MPNRLISVRNDMQRRYEDILMMEKIMEKNQKVESILILKSSLMLMIYNMIEGTMSNLLRDYFDDIHSRNIYVYSLPSEFQKTIKIYIEKKQPDNINDILNNIFNLSYDEITKHLKLFSGNLDSRSIRDVCKKVGIDLDENIKAPELLKVKNVRNKLAHGETTFNNTCQDIVLKDIKKICEKTFEFLNEVLSESEKILDTL